MNIIEKTLGIKEGQRFTFELATELYPTEEYTYENGYITYLSLWNGKKCGIQGTTLIKILNNPDMVKIIQEKKKLPRFVFDWIEYWEEEIGGVDDRELMGINVSQELVRIDILIHKKKTIKSVVLQVHLSNLKATKKMISFEEFYNTFEAEEV